MSAHERPCRRCGEVFSLRFARQVFCSRSCSNRGRRHRIHAPARAALLEALRKADRWLTTAELARHVYGTADRSDLFAVRNVVHHARQAGVAIETRPTRRRNEQAGYRLAERAS